MIHLHLHAYSHRLDQQCKCQLLDAPGPLRVGLLTYCTCSTREGISIETLQNFFIILATQCSGRALGNCQRTIGSYKIDYTKRINLILHFTLNFN